MISNVAVFDRATAKFELCILEDTLIKKHIPVLESKVSIERKKNCQVSLCIVFKLNIELF